MNEQDIRWKQRFSNFQKALNLLTEFIEKSSLNKLEEQGLVKAFEYTYELGWNTLRDYLMHQGFSELVGSRDTFRKAFSTGILLDGQVWMQMIECRNKTSHTYNEATAREIALLVRHSFFPAFKQIETFFLTRKKEDSARGDVLS